jgi:hypothetical protein
VVVIIKGTGATVMLQIHALLGYLPHKKTHPPRNKEEKKKGLVALGGATRGHIASWPHLPPEEIGDGLCLGSFPV